MKTKIRLSLKSEDVSRNRFLNKGTEESCPIFILHCLFSYRRRRMEDPSWIRGERLNGKGGEIE
jgi:hypothetical protein